MKKMKRWLSALLCVATVASVGFSTGCFGDDDKKEDAGKVATKQEKQEVYTNVAGTMETIATSGNTYKISIVVDGTVYEADYKMDSTATAPTVVYTPHAMSVQGDVYFKGSETDASADLVLNLAAEGEFMYAAASVRGDGVYYGMLSEESAITDAQKNALVYMETNLEDIMAQLGGMAPITDGETTGGAVDEGTTSSSWAEMVTTALMGSMDEIVGGLFAGFDSKIKVEKGVTTLTLDIKAEIQSIATVLSGIANVITPTTKLSDLLNNVALKTLYNKYLGDLKATDIQAIFATVVGATPDMLPPVGEMSGYEYLVSIITSMPGEEDGTTMGDMNVYAFKAQLTMVVNEINAMLESVNALTFSVSVKDDMLSGIACNIDVKDAMTLNASITLSQATYTFKDVTQLNMGA